jgi:hypothetical protein
MSLRFIKSSSKQKVSYSLTGHGLISQILPEPAQLAQLFFSFLIFFPRTARLVQLAHHTSACLACLLSSPWPTLDFIHKSPTGAQAAVIFLTSSGIKTKGLKEFFSQPKISTKSE